MADVGRGLPLLSGPPPATESAHPDIACRKCNKEFNIVFTRSRKCNHCGYSYCHSCSDFQALMPREGSDSGYDATNVCAFCIEFLTITAAGKLYLRGLPLSRLKKYANAYNIRIDGAVEKDDIIDAIINARTPNGCLSPQHENYYRNYSVPNKAAGNRTRWPFSRGNHSQSTQATPPPPPPPPPRTSVNHFPRPDLAPDNPSPAPQYHSRPQFAAPPPPPPPPHHSRPPSPPLPRYHRHPQYPHGQNSSSYASHQPFFGASPSPPPPPPPPSFPLYPNRPQSQSSQSAPSPRQRTTSHTAPPPTLDALLDMTSDAIYALSISALKQILFTNHVNAGMILEKGELVRKVLTLVEDERTERETRLQMEELERIEREDRAQEREHERQREARESAEVPHRGSSSENNDDNEAGSSMNPPPSPSSKIHAMQFQLERTGLCVICQDEEANIAIVDCGHLAMCRGCSDLVMANSRECPLCRTRIVTEARLLRIFKP